MEAPGSVFFGATPRGGLKRSWTLSVDPAAARGRVIISVKRGANGSRRLHDTISAPHGAIHMLGVAGDFTPALARPETRPVLLLAGGIGITPFRAMIPAFAAQRRPLALVSSVRTIAGEICTRRDRMRRSRTLTRCHDRRGALRRRAGRARGRHSDGHGDRRAAGQRVGGAARARRRGAACCERTRGRRRACVRRVYLRPARL